MGTFATRLLAAAALTALAGCTTPASTADKDKDKAAGRDCFNADMVSSYAVADDTTVNLRVGVKDFYQIKLFGTCPDIKWSNAIALESAGSSFVCTGIDLTVISPSPMGRQTCPATSIRRLTPEEVAALPPKQKP